MRAGNDTAAGIEDRHRDGAFRSVLRKGAGESYEQDGQPTRDNADQKRKNPGHTSSSGKRSSAQTALSATMFTHSGRCTSGPRTAAGRPFPTEKTLRETFSHGWILYTLFGVVVKIFIVKSCARSG